MAAFSLYYWRIGGFAAPGAATFFGIFLTSAVAVRLLAISMLHPRAAAFGRASSGLVDALFVLCWSALVAIFFIGIVSWGQVPTVNLLAPYLSQIPMVLDVIGIRPFYVWFIALLVVGLLVTVVFLQARTARAPSAVEGWIRVNPSLRAPLVAVLSSCTLVSGFMAYTASLFGHEIQEPLSLMFVPKPRVDVQSGSMDSRALSELRSRESKAARFYPTGAHGTQKNVILITVDALRPDRMHAFGHNRLTTPFLSGLVQSNGLMPLKQARATCAESMCGIVALLNGRAAHHSPWISFGLPDVLKRVGYTTVATLSGDHTNFYGLRERLGAFDVFSDGATAGVNPRMNDDNYVMDRLRRQVPTCGAKPLFLYVHLMSSHLLGKKHATFTRWVPVKSPARMIIGEIDSQSKSEMRNFYDNGVLQADAKIEEIYAILREKGCLQDSIVVITADHGEFLGEYGRVQHAATVLEPVLRIPWLSQGISVHPRNQSSPILQEDLAPSILTELGLPIPQTWRGQPLQLPSDRPFSFHSQGVWAALIDFRGADVLKYVVNRSTQTAAAYRLDAADAEGKDVLGVVSNNEFANGTRCCCARG
ncbi:MAG: hypothetical protein EAZ43_02140 [Betaproteobacteria bacterium]|nr:MAG: hypothetical protein EAZ43_02140 [Betaproteobacteria bacterium]